MTVFFYARNPKSTFQISIISDESNTQKYSETILRALTIIIVFKIHKTPTKTIDTELFRFRKNSKILFKKSRLFHL